VDDSEVKKLEEEEKTILREIEEAERLADLRKRREAIKAKLAADRGETPSL